MKALKLAIAKQLTNDTDYLALMGVPTSEPYNTFFLTPPEKPTFPETVFNFGGVGYDTSQDREIQAADIRLNFTVWSENGVYEDIIKRIKVLFHQKTIGITGAHAIVTGETDELRDEEFDVYGKVLRIAVFYRRGIYE